MAVKRVSIKDIAEKTQVSAGTVHRALNGKAGVGDTTRQYILDTAKELGYQPNYIASSLKRKPLRIVVAFPAYTDHNRFFYPFVWKGFRKCMEEMIDYNVETIEVPYYGGMGSQKNELLAVYDRYEGMIDGLITIGHISNQDAYAVKKFVDNGCTVVLACDDNKNTGRKCCVIADFVRTGMMAAELIAGRVPKNSKVLIMAGNPTVQSHYETVQGFERYLEQENYPLEIIRVYGQDGDETVQSQIIQRFRENPDIAASYSVNARNGVVLCNAAREIGVEKEMIIIGSDVYSESIENCKQGILNNVVYKDPFQQGYLATKTLLDYLIKNEEPSSDVLYVRTEVLFKSNIDLFEN